MRKVKTDFSELGMAFEAQDSEGSWYLDCETGRVMYVPHHVNRRLEQFLEGEPEGTEDEARGFKEWVEQCDCPDWEKDELEEAYEVQKGCGARFVPIPQDDSHDAYQDMQDFTDAVTDERLKELLWVALDGKGAFRRFKDALTRYPEERERWFAFRDERLKERLLEWLESVDIEPVE